MNSYVPALNGRGNLVADNRRGGLSVLLRAGKSGFFPGCPFRLLTGFTCPGCGTTRALHQILHGHFDTAFTLNPLLLLLAIPFLLFALIRYSVIVMRGGVPDRTHCPLLISTPSSSSFCRSGSFATRLTIRLSLELRRFRCAYRSSSFSSHSASSYGSTGKSYGLG